MSLKGQVALVLGGASGIGLATVQELLREGANVTVGDVSVAAGEEAVKELQQQFGAERVLFLRTDVCSDAEMEAAFVTTKQRFNRMDIFINSAGIFNDFKWNLEVDTNMKGVIRGSLLAWKHMGKNEGGRGGVVINIASIAGLTALHICPIYVATKHAIVGLCRSLGMQFNFDHTGVRFVTICPGATDTAMAQTNWPDKRVLYDELLGEIESTKNTFQWQKPDNVAKAVLHVIQQAESGSVWVSENSEPAYEVAIPPYQDLRVTN